MNHHIVVPAMKLSKINLAFSSGGSARKSFDVLVNVQNLNACYIVTTGWGRGLRKRYVGLSIEQATAVYNKF